MDREQNNSSHMGSNIPVLDVDVSIPIDVKKAVETLGGSTQMFYMMLEKFEDMSLMDCMQKLAKDVERKDFKEMKLDAHSLKGASGYIAASHIHYACYFIQEHHQYDRYQEMMEYYPTLLEAAVEFRIFSRQLLAKYKNQQYKIVPEHETIPIANGFRIAKDPKDGTYYALQGNQTIADRIKTKQRQILKPQGMNGQQENPDSVRGQQQQQRRTTANDQSTNVMSNNIRSDRQINQYDNQSIHSSGQLMTASFNNNKNRYLQSQEQFHQFNEQYAKAQTGLKDVSSQRYNQFNRQQNYGINRGNSIVGESKSNQFSQQMDNFGNPKFESPQTNSLVNISQLSNVPKDVRERQQQKFKEDEDQYMQTEEPKTISDSSCCTQCTIF